MRTVLLILTVVCAIALGSASLAAASSPSQTAEEKGAAGNAKTGSVKRDEAAKTVDFAGTKSSATQSEAGKPSAGDGRKRVRSLDDWAKLSAKDIDRIEREMDEEDFDDIDAKNPHHPRNRNKAPSFDPRDIDMSDPEALLRASRKGKPVMIVVRIANSASKRDTETTLTRWQHALKNAHMEVQRFIVQEGHGIFMTHDGSNAWAIRDFLVQQPELDECSFESQTYKGIRHGAASWVNLSPEEKKRRYQTAAPPGARAAAEGAESGRPARKSARGAKGSSAQSRDAKASEPAGQTSDEL